jgi:hypothetical protein
MPWDETQAKAIPCERLSIDSFEDRARIDPDQVGSRNASYRTEALPPPSCNTQRRRRWSEVFSPAIESLERIQQNSLEPGVYAHILWKRSS